MELLKYVLGQFGLHIIIETIHSTIGGHNGIQQKQNVIAQYQHYSISIVSTKGKHCHGKN